MTMFISLGGLAALTGDRLDLTDTLGLINGSSIALVAGATVGFVQIAWDDRNQGFVTPARGAVDGTATTVTVTHHDAGFGIRQTANFAGYTLDEVSGLAGLFERLLLNAPTPALLSQIYAAVHKTIGP